jgi:carbonic anhydrase
MRFTRRDLARLGASAGLAVTLGRISGGNGIRTAQAVTSATPDQALQMLMDGNQRFVSGNVQHPNQSAAARMAGSGGQSPFAAILSCVDSRVPPEIVFDQGLGDLFTARAAAGIYDDAIFGSLEFGIEEFHIPLILVMGHQSCGAVRAVLDAIKTGQTEVPGKIAAVVERILPAALQVQNSPGDLLGNATRAVVQQSVREIRASDPIMASAIASGSLDVRGAYYSIDTGMVELVDTGGAP